MVERRVDPPGAKSLPRLLDLLQKLRALSPRIQGTQSLAGVGETAVALSADLPAGGRADLRLHVRPEPDGTWRVTWLAAPAGSWPIPEKPAL